jgi:histidinol-phosphatase (PHP family)
VNNQLLHWWHEEGGDALTFGADSHSPDLIAHQFPQAAALAQAAGYLPDHSHPWLPWRRG